MGKKSLMIFLMVLAAGSYPAFARLGETEKELDERYGPPVSTAKLANFTRCQYEKTSFAITVFYQNGASVLETFARRGLDQKLALDVAAHISGRPIGVLDPAQENQIRQAAGISCKEEVFWTWSSSDLPVTAAFDPSECVLAIFRDPGVYAAIQQALASAPLAGP